MSSLKKRQSLNQNYPVLGFRVTKDERDEFIESFEELMAVLSAQPEYRRLNLKKNAVFLRALEIGIEQLRKRKSLG